MPSNPVVCWIELIFLQEPFLPARGDSPASGLRDELHFAACTCTILIAMLNNTAGIGDDLS
jgi:hypothetical protein